ncbi:MAG: energy-coupling factor ABC transporter permease, partial [Oscillospiraceae bacterium]
MHMADALLSPAVGGIMYAVSAGAIAYSVKKLSDDPLADKKVPVMAVSGAFVFATQMINFAIPGTGSSGHLGGGILLAVMLGGGPALLAMTAVLLIQCLFFADGGLLALGCNIFNMGVLPCLFIYPLVFKPFLKKGISKGRITAAALISCVFGLQLGAFGVVLETVFSGISVLPFGTFILLMQPIHFAIGLVEGLVTAAVLCYIYSAQPELISSNLRGSSSPFRIGKKVLIPLIIAALIVGGVFS